MASVRTNWQAWLLALLTGAAALEWYLLGRHTSGRVISLLIVAMAVACALACVLYVGRAIGNRALNGHAVAMGFSSFGTVLTALYGAWACWVDVGGVGSDFDYAVAWGLGTVATCVLGYAEIRAAGQLVAELADTASHAADV